MAEKKSTVTYESIMKDIKARQFSPIYILMGEESYFIDRICDAISQSVLPEEEREFNQFQVFGSDVSASQIADLARELPMMSQYKVIIVKEAQNIKQTEALEKYFENPSMQTVLVYCYKNGTIDKRKKFLSKAEKSGVIFESKKKKDQELPGFVESYLKVKKATIENKAAHMIAESVGADLARLVSELDKLLIALPDSDRRVTPEMVEQQIGVSKEFNSFELKNAIVNRDILKANRIIAYFDKNPKAGSVFSVLPLLFNYFQNLMIAYYAPNRNNENAVAAHLDLKSSWGARDYITGMRNYSGMKTMQIISKMREIDAKSKGLDNPNTPSGELLKELIFFIFH